VPDEKIGLTNVAQHVVVGQNQAVGVDDNAGAEFRGHESRVGGVEAFQRPLDAWNSFGRSLVATGLIPANAGDRDN
jgi:hypothetical protein